MVNALLTIGSQLKAELFEFEITKEKITQAKTNGSAILDFGTHKIYPYDEFVLKLNSNIASYLTNVVRFPKKYTAKDERIKYTGFHNETLNNVTFYCFHFLATDDGETSITFKSLKGFDDKDKTTFVLTIEEPLLENE